MLTINADMGPFPGSPTAHTLIKALQSLPADAEVTIDSWDSQQEGEGWRITAYWQEQRGAQHDVPLTVTSRYETEEISDLKQEIADYLGMEHGGYRDGSELDTLRAAEHIVSTFVEPLIRKTEHEEA